MKICCNKLPGLHLRYNKHLKADLGYLIICIVNSWETSNIFFKKIELMC